MSRKVVVTAERSHQWWVLESAEAGVVSQCRRLDQAADEVREAIAYQLGVPEDDLDIEVVPTLPAEFQAEAQAARDLRQAAQDANTAAAAHSRAAARILAEAGLPLRDVGAIMGVSHQRAAQLLAG